MQDFTTWTKEDFLAFDARRQELFALTQEEIDAQNAQIEQNKQTIIVEKLSAIGEVKPEIITKEYVIGLLEKIKAQKYVGGNLSKWVDNQILLFGDIETAFNDLVFRYL